MPGFETRHVSGLGNPEIKSQLAKPRTPPPSMPDRPMLGVVCGSRGSGKSSALINFVKLYAPHHFFDKVIICSPTFFNDPKLAHLVDDRYESQVVTDVHHEAVEDIIMGIKDDIEDYKKYQKYIDVWKRMMKAKDLDVYLSRADPEDVAMLMENDYQPPTTKFKYGMPTTLWICDDLVGEKAIYNNPILNKFLLQHRHYLTSVLFAVQVWKGGVPRGIRNNLSLAMLFTNKSKPVRMEVAEELSAFIAPDRFIELWDFCCKEPHDFLMINWDDPKHRFRKNFDSIITGT
jgi:hypothetical protein